MTPLQTALIIVAAILELLAALSPLVPPNERWGVSLVALGLFFALLSRVVGG